MEASLRTFEVWKPGLSKSLTGRFRLLQLHKREPGQYCQRQAFRDLLLGGAVEIRPSQRNPEVEKPVGRFLANTQNATNTATGSKVDVLEVGYASTIDPNYIGRWPVPDAQDVPKSWDGLESPQPPPPPNGYPSGPIISVSYGPTDDVAINGASFSDHLGPFDPNDYYVLTPTNDGNLEGSNSYFLYTHEPLIDRRTHQVSTPP